MSESRSRSFFFDNCAALDFVKSGHFYLVPIYNNVQRKREQSIMHYCRGIGINISMLRINDIVAIILAWRLYCYINSIISDTIGCSYCTDYVVGAVMMSVDSVMPS